MSGYRFHEDRVEKYRCADDVERPIHLWEVQYSKAVFVAIHGGMAHGGDFCTPALYFREHGWTTIAPDLRGHCGQRRVDIQRFDDFVDDLKLLLEWTRENYPDQPIVIMGHSVGGLIATRYGLKSATENDGVVGYVMSSPFWANAIPIPPVVVSLAGILARVVPRMKAPIANFSHVLTHDAAIVARHEHDDADGIRAQEVTIRFGNEQRLMHNFVRESIHEWRHPLFVAIAGNDQLADSNVSQNYVSRIDAELVDAHVYTDNYHENLNETNREEIFKQILGWSEPLLDS